MKNGNVDGQPLVSIVTPVYNGEKYLRECMASVIGQTYSNWEYIVVNNRSTDGTLEVAEEYARKSSKIRVVTNDEHLGIFQNWNHALEQISPDSRYCKIVHADDWLFTECLSRMVACAEENPSVGIVGSYRLEETRVTCTGIPYSTCVVAGRDMCRSHWLGENYQFGSPTTLLLRSELIRSKMPFYNVENFHCDLEVCCELLREWDFGFVHQVLTFTRRANESNTTYARRMNTFMLGELRTLLKFGAFYLSKAEFSAILEKRIKNYYRFLGRSLFERKGKEFWNYHRTGLSSIGYPMRLSRVISSALIVAFNHALESLKIR